MGVLQNIRDGLRAFIYKRAQDFISVEDSRQKVERNARRDVNFKAFYDARGLGEKGYQGYDDFDARLLYGFYEKYGEKGLALTGFYKGGKLRSKELLDLRKFVEHCELLEDGKGPEAGIDLSQRLVDEFSLDKIVKTMGEFNDPYVSFTLSLRNMLDKIDAGREQQEKARERHRDNEHNRNHDREQEKEQGSREEREQVSDVEALIAGANERSSKTQGIGVKEKDVGVELV